MKNAEIREMAKELINDAIKDLPGAEVYEDLFGDKVKSVYLGTVFHIMPSGKFYTPWACGNVSPCEKCNGRGCSYCGFLGSREAFEDRMMQDHLDRIAYKFGCYVMHGEGDPTDIFLMQTVSDASDEDKDDESIYEACETDCRSAESH